MQIVSEAPPSFHKAARRPGPVGLLREAASEAWSRRRLVRYLVEADLKKKGADTLLGNVWWVLDPLLQMLVYVILISFIFQRTQPDYPLFLFAAILPWKWFTSTIGDSITAVTGQERLIKQLNFPKLVLPVAATFAGIVNFAFGLIPLAALLVLFYSDRISPLLVFIPIIAAVQLVFSLAMSLVVAALNVFYRDISNVSRHVLRLWFYLSPALYSASALEPLSREHPTLVRLFHLNPFFVLFNSYRNVIYGDAAGYPLWPDWIGLAVLLLASVGLLGLATLLFKRLEPAFAKVL
jgi:ABC-type polysaccharide/polyol phosphate export permease